MRFTLVTASSAFLLVGCTNPNEAQKVLEAVGYEGIEMTGYEFNGCGKDDQDHDGFTAVSMTGAKVKGVVCGGWMKGRTIRVTQILKAKGE